MKTTLFPLILCVYILSAKAQDSLAQNNFSGTQTIDRVWVLTSNFTLPAVRFNRWKNGYDNNSSGQLELFNSVGAGVSLLWGNILEVHDDKNTEEPMYTEFSNIFGFNLGVLFSKSNAKDGLDDNIFAIVGGISILDVQVGYGREFGNRAEGIKRGFVTVSYAIPLFKLTKKSAINLNKLNKGSQTKSSPFL